MPIPLKDFKPRELEKCVECGAELCPIPDADPSPPVTTTKGKVCGDCITADFGKLIEAHPIGRAIVRG